MVLPDAGRASSFGGMKFAQATGNSGRNWVAWILAAALGATVARAHDTWLEPERFAATPGATLGFSLTSAAEFGPLESAVKPWRVRRALMRLGGETTFLGEGVTGEKALAFKTTLPRPGVAVVWLELKPRTLELTAEKVEEYFREIHASDELRAQWTALPEPKKWRETYVKHVKTFVRVGEPVATERAWAEPVGAALEIVPERDPTKLKLGDELPVRVLRSGVAVENFMVAFVASGGLREHVIVTGPDGRAKMKLDLAGEWMVHGTDLRRSTEPDLEWESDFVTMVVSVAK